jgi:hypothetical protein
MVGVVQLVERQVVILNVAGSSPVTHPNGKCRPACAFAGRTRFVIGAMQRTMQQHGDAEARQVVSRPAISLGTSARTSASDSSISVSLR